MLIWWSAVIQVQRMGRTGRKRQGRIVILVTEGKEAQVYNQSLYQRKSILKTIMSGTLVTTGKMKQRSTSVMIRALRSNGLTAE